MKKNAGPRLPHSKRKGDLKRRLEAPATYLPAKCAIPGCGRPTSRAAGNGLAIFHCKYHVQHKARHGSHWKKSYRATELKHYKQAAAIWIKRNRKEFYVAHALKALGILLQTSGRVVPAMSFRGMTSYEKARVALARLREKGVQPEKLLVTYVAVVAILKEDPYSLRASEFRIVQIAKAVHRMASGTHRRWDFHFRDGTTAPIVIHKYPKSSGLVLRRLGKMIEECCEWVNVQHLPAILALKIERYGPHPDAFIPDKAKTSHPPPPSPR